MVGVSRYHFLSINFRYNFCSKKEHPTTLPATGSMSAAELEDGPSGTGLQCHTGAKAAKREVRVRARGRSSSHATIRSIFIAAAIATCCKWVLTMP